ncbi:hypothetical protein [Alteromonas sp. BMJM2]|uniref:hypothetical protein n=1 Tax=Alteromonas sp. BMJM2 TaxID=2954241 RepID=UPI0022B4B978|nr:hypothetical protein [Alteromonas sp. BMJM2]
MSQLNKIDYQRYVEITHSKKQVNKVILNDLTAEQEMIDLIASTADALTQWLEGDYYHSKNERLIQLEDRDMQQIVLDILCETAVLTDPVEFTSIVGQCAGVLRMSDKYEGIVTTAEIMSVIAEYDLFDIFKMETDEGATLHLMNNIELSEQVHKHLRATKYLPPMIVQPNEVTRNYDSDLLTESSSMILGKGTHHDEDICLDSINTFNRIPLCLNERILTQLSEVPKKADMPADTKRQWLTFVTESYRTYRDLIQTGNKFYERHKVDKRGRTYAQGYHVSTQGNQFRKAIVEFADKEVIEG